MMRRLALSLLALAALSAAPYARAQQPEGDVAQARELFVEGVKLSDAGAWEAARERFERSIKLKRAALTMYNLGIARQETGHLVDAMESFRAFLAMPVEPGTQAFVAPVRATLAKLEERVPRLQLDVRPADLAGLSVRLDGREVPPTGGPWMVDPGTHEIVADVPGYGYLRQTTQLPEGARTTIALSIPPRPPPRAPSVALPAGLAMGGLALLVGGEIAFAVGAKQVLGSPSSSGSARAAMIAGDAAAGAGAFALGIGLGLLLRMPPARAQSATVAPWVGRDAAGVRIRF